MFAEIYVVSAHPVLTLSIFHCSATTGLISLDETAYATISISRASVLLESGGIVDSLTGTRLHSTDNERVRTENPNLSKPQTLSATIHYVVSHNIKLGVERKTQAITVLTCRTLVADLHIYERRGIYLISPR